ncbi:MAG: iron-containing alcohol dehydrogenase, partial [Firmicutes bacterium]|nr:iron-containing alcohol dehydrogenase [Bacillota bacterium]
GSESTNNAVIELGEEKRSIRNIPPPTMIVTDPSFTDSLPLTSTVISLVDAIAQSLEVLTHEKATPEGQAIALAALLNLVQGMRGLIQETKNAPGTSAVSQWIRDSLSWGSLLMGIAFAHAGLGLPHALVHFCNKFGLAHGHMVGILLVPGLTVQAEHDPATARRLARVAEALAGAAQAKKISLPAAETEEDETAPVNSQASRFLTWLDQAIAELFTRVNLVTALQPAGLDPVDLDWIADRESALGASFGIPKRQATKEELLTVLHKAWSKHNP